MERLDRRLAEAAAALATLDELAGKGGTPTGRGTPPGAGARRCGSARRKETEEST